MGELHLDVLIDRLVREFNIECNKGTPSVAYKETISETAQYTEVYKKQTGGKGKFAELTIEVSPADKREEGLQFIDDVRGGSIPKEFIPSIKKGIETAMSNGALLGFPMDAVKVRLLDGSYHNVDSDKLSFEIAGSIAFKEACKLASPVLLEPLMSLEVVTPDNYVGDISSDISKRRGTIEHIDSKAGNQIVHANVPLAEMFGYVTTLRSISSGRATYSLEFLRYETTSREIMESIIYKIKGYLVSI
jgi:elongation factor G